MLKQKRQALYFRKTFPEKILLALYYFIVDSYKNFKSRNNKPFDVYGLSVFFGMQGSGKTTSAVAYVKDLKQKYPNVKIYSNLDIDIMDGRITDIDDLLNIRNGTDGVIFLIDEISALFESGIRAEKMPPGLLSEITQQRKQRIHIVGTAQSFMRLHKQLREQTFSCVRSFNLFGRVFFNIAYNAEIYENYHDSATTGEQRKKLKRLYRRWYVADNKLFNSFDTYQKVERIWKVALKNSKEEKKNA